MTESTTDLSTLKRPKLNEIAAELDINSFGKKNEQLREEIAKARKAAVDQAAPDVQADPDAEGSDAFEVDAESGGDAAAPADAAGEPKGETYANGVFVPDGVEPGKSPDWPLFETEGGDWLPLDLTDEQRKHLATNTEFGDGAYIEIEPEEGPCLKIIRDGEGDYVAVDFTESEPDPDERHGIDVPVDGVATTLSEDGAERTIARENDGAWWCPFCGTSMLHGINRCPKCASVREGDVAVKR